ncbi:NAC domain-containing protein 90 [Lolium perenne]|uniref:NAC domain-containing protein 90 n=1 Tax=Lolium perenne TaxID=4522 RepID=UPI0021F64BB3|nr:NAC domain-containing protein 90-like [Lolium perenne]
MAELPPGYRFYPTEEELVRFYLRHKLDGSRRDDIERVIPVADVCSVDPWQLPEAHPAAFGGDGEPWFYFCARQDREARGGRPSRTTPSGYWKAAGTPGLVYSADGRPVGTKKTMVFYCGRAPAGAKTDWKMNEYRAFDDDDADVVAPAPNPFLQARSEFSLCRLYTRLDNLRQFDRRPCTAARCSAFQDLASSSAAAALANEDDEAGRGQKRKRHAATDGTSSSDDADRPMQHQHQHQQHQEQEDADEELLGDMADWAEFLDWI